MEEKGKEVQLGFPSDFGGEGKRKSGKTAEKGAGEERGRQPKIRTAKKGTSFFSGPYPEGGEWLTDAKEDMTIGVYEDERNVKRNRDGWIFFPTTHEVAYGGDPERQITAWVAKTFWKQKGYVKL